MKQDIGLLLRKKKGRLLSGEYIARTLGISRAAVWKQIKKLRSKGYSITSKRREGYRLVSSAGADDLERFSCAGVRLRYFLSIGSTQIAAKKYARAGAPEKTVVLADKQSAAYGRMQREWFAPAGGLWFSMVLRPPCTPAEASVLTLIMGLSVAAAIRSHMKGADVQVKWPNDVLIAGRKVCGILAEMQSEMDRVSWMVIGAGINVNNPVPAPLRRRATSISYELKKPFSRTAVLGTVLNCFFSYYRTFKRSGFKVFMREYERYSYLKGKRASIAAGNETVHGKITGIDASGGLIVKARGRTRVFYAGEVVSARKK